MFHMTTCPTCHTKFTIPEEQVGRRQICPHCQSPFVAGKSAALPAPPPVRQEQGSAAAAAGAAGYNRTMLADAEPPVRYNCPRCRTPLESPASEAGTKKPCPSCGQRLQVPAAPPPAAAAQAGLNKTMLAADESQAPPQPPVRYNCPNCKKPLESPASEAGTKKPCPACGQRLQVPAAAARPGLNKTMLAGDASTSPIPGAATQPLPGGHGHAAGAAPGGPPGAAGGFLPLSPKGRRIAAVAAGVSFVLLLGLCIIPAFLGGGDFEDQAALARMKAELAGLTKEMEQTRAEMAKQREIEKALREQRDKDTQDYINKINEWKLQSDLTAANEAYRNDKSVKAEMDRKLAIEKERIENEKRLADARRAQEEAQAKARLDELEVRLQAASQRSQTIIQQPAPVVHYPPYHPHYYHPRWGPWWW